jgi:uncharacterized membrane protein YfcA
VTWTWYPLLFCTGLVAGWVDSIAGGGGLITIPVLLGTGMSPQMVLGTNKFQASFGSLTAATYYVREGVVPLKDAVPGIVFTLIGAALGTLAVQQIQSSVLNTLIPILLLGIAVYTLFTPKLGVTTGKAVFGRMWFYGLFGLTLGFYDGFFGPGVGSFWAVAFVLGLGTTLLTATGYTKVMNAVSNIVSLALFLAGRNVMFEAGAVMAVGQILGARIGSGLVVRRGARFIRPVFITVVLLTTLKILYDRFSG